MKRRSFVSPADKESTVDILVRLLKRGPLTTVQLYARADRSRDSINQTLREKPELFECLKKETGRGYSFTWGLRPVEP